MSWRLAKALEGLRAQINAPSPNRSKASDGSIGDTAHSARASDHNPNKAGVVCALDITHDPAHGVNSQALADALVGRDYVPTVTSTAVAQPAPAATVTPAGTAGAVVTTTGDVTSETKISIGTYAGQALMWISAAFAAPLGALLVSIFYKVLQGVGFSLTDAMRARLEEAVVNGINA